MKLKRAAKDNEPLIAAAPAKPAATTGNDSQALLPGAIVALGGLVLACALLGFGLSGSGKQQQQQLVEAWGGSQASALQQAQQQLLALLRQCSCRLGIGTQIQHADIRPGDKTVRLGRGDDDTGRWLLVHGLQPGRKLGTGTG